MLSPPQTQSISPHTLHMPPDLPLLALNLDFYPAYFGELLNNQYRVLRNVGGGAHSSVWIVQDTKFDKNGSGGVAQRYILSPYAVRSLTDKTLCRIRCREYLAVKILTAEMTRGHTTGQSREQALMERIQARGEEAWRLPVLCDSFRVTSSYGSHLCFVMNTLGGSINDLRKPAPGKALPVYLVKNIIAQLVDAVAQLHELDIIHPGAPRSQSH